MPRPDAIDWLDRLKTISQLSFDFSGTSLLATISPSSSPRGVSLASRIWRFGLDGRAEQLTDGPNGDALAKTSPVGDRIAYISDRVTAGKKELLVLERGVARGLGDLPGSVEDYHWSPTGDEIFVLSADRGLNGGATTGATRLWWGEEEDPEVTCPSGPLRRLFRINVVSGRTDEVGPQEFTIWEFVLVPGGAVAVVSHDSSERGWYHPRIVRIDFSNRRAETIHQSDWQIQGLTVDPTGTQIAFLEGWSSDRGLCAGEMHVLDLATREVTVLAPDRHSNVTALHWRDADTLLFVGWRNLGSVYGLVTTGGDILLERTEDGIVGDGPYVAQMAVSGDFAALAAIRETIGRPQEIFWKVGADEEWQQISDVNGTVARQYPEYPEIRHVSWTGLDGLALESFVYVPRGLGPGPHPMIVNIHGGPCTSAKYAFDPYQGLAFAAAGYVVFVPNYRGNVGWGQAFTRMNIGDPAGAEFDDIQAGIDKCIELGLADPDRLGVTGLSYGGYLTAWAVATTDKFKAAIPTSSICDQMSSHYSCEHDFHEFINGGTLNDERFRAIARDRSPLARLDAPTTPTLLIQGRDDRCTPLGQAQEFYAALKERGVVTELVVYPREGHFLFETEHRRDSCLRQISWFDRFLKQVVHA